MRPARSPTAVLRISNFPNKARATRRGSRSKNSAFSTVARPSEVMASPIPRRVGVGVLRAISAKFISISTAQAAPRLAPKERARTWGTAVTQDDRAGPGHCRPAARARLHRALQILQHFVGVPFGFHVVEDVFDLAVGTNHERCARDSLHFFAIHVFLFDYAEEIRDLLLRIGQ